MQIVIKRAGVAIYNMKKTSSKKTCKRQRMLLYNDEKFN